MKGKSVEYRIGAAWGIHGMPERAATAVLEQTGVPESQIHMKRLGGEDLFSFSGRRGEFVPHVLTVVREAWLEVLLDDQWIVAYRLMMQDGTPVVAAMSILPAGLDGTRPLGRWAGDVLGDDAPVPPGGITARLLRRAPLEQHLDLARESLSAWTMTYDKWAPRLTEIAHRVAAARGRPDEGSELAARYDAALAPPLDIGDACRELRRRRGPIGHTDHFFAEIAQAYAAAVAAGSPRPVEDVVGWLAKRGHHLGRSTVAGHVREARRRGFLSPALRGRPGGHLTEFARRLLSTTSSRRESG